VPSHPPHALNILTTTTPGSLRDCCFPLQPSRRKRSPGRLGLKTRCSVWFLQCFLQALMTVLRSHQVFDSPNPGLTALGFSSLMPISRRAFELTVASRRRTTNSVKSGVIIDVTLIYHSMLLSKSLMTRLIVGARGRPPQWTTPNPKPRLHTRFPNRSDFAKASSDNFSLCEKLVDRRGVEPLTLALQRQRSTTELPAHESRPQSLG
jgi:hypothetical protein